jgi:sigma-B regulation protein RsbU (phosphoserine phosphatase)
VPVGSFAAAFIGIYDVSTGRLEYANCGHQPEPWCIPGDKDSEIYSLSDARNLIMGVEEVKDIKTSSMKLGAGDVVLFVSDGIVENKDVDGELYEIERFEEFIRCHRSVGLKEFVGLIVEEAGNYSSNAVQNDDRTILAFKIKA